MVWSFLLRSNSKSISPENVFEHEKVNILISRLRKIT